MTSIKLLNYLNKNKFLKKSYIGSKQVITINKNKTITIAVLNSEGIAIFFLILCFFLIKTAGMHHI